jgi:hypothetical protein
MRHNRACNRKGTGNASKILIYKPHENRPFGRLKTNTEDNIIINFT